MVEIGLNAPLPGIGRWGTLAWGAGAHSGVALVMFCACVLLIRVAGYPAVAVVMGLSVLTVGVVAFGFGLPRVDPDGPPLWRLLYSLGSRESLVPLGLSTGLLASGLLPVVSAWSTVLERYPILWLIMTFALLSYGMERSGFFRFLAVRTLLLCRGSVPALTVGFFLLSSVLTYFASNDIVVLVMTPLVLELSRQSGIRGRAAAALGWKLHSRKYGVSRSYFWISKQRDRSFGEGHGLRGLHAPDGVSDRGCGLLIPAGGRVCPWLRGGAYGQCTQVRGGVAGDGAVRGADAGSVCAFSVGDSRVQRGPEHRLGILERVVGIQRYRDGCPAGRRGEGSCGRWPGPGCGTRSRCFLGG